MERSYRALLFFCSVLLLSLSLSAGDKSSVCPESGTVTAAFGLLGSVAAAATVKKLYDQKELLAQENQALQTQVTALGVMLAVCQTRDEQDSHLHCCREHSRLQQTNASLEKQNRLLAEVCPPLQVAAQQEFRCGCDHDVAASWGCD